MKRPIHRMPTKVIALSKILIPDSDRISKKEGKDIAELAADIKAKGLETPVVVSPYDREGHGKPAPRNIDYDLRAGRVRTLAAKSIGWSEIECVVIDIGRTLATSTMSRLVVLVEQCQLRQLSDYDIAKAACEMKDKHQITVPEFSKTLGLSESYCYNLVRWYSQSQPEIRDEWKAGAKFLTQTELEMMIHMSREQALEYYAGRVRMRSGGEAFQPGKSRRKERPQKRNYRASERALLNLMQAVDHSKLHDPAKKLCESIIRFALGDAKDVPGITDFYRLAPELVANDKREEEPRIEAAAAI